MSVGELEETEDDDNKSTATSSATSLENSGISEPGIAADASASAGSDVSPSAGSELGSATDEGLSLASVPVAATGWLSEAEGGLRPRRTAWSG